MTAATTKIERSSDPHGARRARPDECTQFETEFRQALARAETDSDLAAVEAVRDRWWGAAVMAANPLSEAERDQVVARAGDERLVVCRRVDHQTVVAPVGHEVAGQRAHSVAADTPPVHDGVEEDIDRGVPVRGLLLLAVLRHPAHRAVQQDGEACGGRVVEGPLRRSGLVAPTQPHLGRVQDPPQFRHVLGGDSHQHDPLPTQAGTRGRTGSGHITIIAATISCGQGVSPVDGGRGD